jgi:hypothetical protein
VADAAKPGERAVAECEIDDVFLVSTECKVDRQYNQSVVGLDDLPALHRVAIDNNVLMQTRTLAPPSEGSIFILRYYIKGEILYPKPGETLEGESVDDSKVLAKLTHEFAVDYRCQKEFFEDKVAVAAFGKNALFHVWGFWREAVISDSARFRLPRVIVPMMKVKSPFTPQAQMMLPATQASTEDNK